MRDSIIGGIIGAIITGLFSLLTFYLGDFSTQESIVETLSVRFDSVDKEMSYEQALEVIYQERATDKKEIESLNARLNELNIKINNQESIIDQQKTEEEINKIIQNAIEYGESFDYIQAISILGNIKDKTPEVKMLINDYSQKYETYIVEEVNKLISEEKLNDANDLINETLNILPNSQTLKNKLLDIENSYPQNMLDVVPAYQNGGNPYTEYVASKSGATDVFSMGGIKYTNGMTFNADYNIFEDVSWAVYNLGGKYNSLEFTVCHVDGTYNGDETYLQIFYDGNLKEEVLLSPDMSPTPISIDITGVTQLKLQVPASGASAPLYGIGNPMIK